MQLTALFAAPQWLQGEKRKKGDSLDNSHPSRANQLFYIGNTNGLFSPQNEYILSEEDEKC